jgi:hypothetical protein
VHVYALAISASVLLSFFPFLNVMLSVCRNVLHSRAAEDAIYLALNDYFPGELAGFLKRNLALQGQLHLTSMVLLLFTANGIFEPLEVALNRAWGEVKNRSYLKNQLVALGMIFLCGALALVSLMLTAAQQAVDLDVALAGRRAVVAEPADVQAGRRAHLDSGALPDLLAAAQPQDSAGARGAGGHLRGADSGSPQIREPGHRAVSAGEAGARVLHLPPLGRHPAVELHRRHGGFGGRRMDARARGRKIRYRRGHEELGSYRAGPRPDSFRRELDRHRGAAGALEETFRPLVKQLTPDMEPDLELHLGGGGGE